MSGTSDSSPSPDDLFESRRKSRKPDLRLYVPPNGKRQNVIEQPKQDVSFKRPTPLDSFHHSSCSKVNKYRSPTDYSKEADLSISNGSQIEASPSFLNIVVDSDVNSDSVCAHGYDKRFGIRNVYELKVTPKKGLGGPPPQPDPSKLPQQQIEALLKKYNILGVKKEAAPPSNIPASSSCSDQAKSSYDPLSSLPSSSNDYALLSNVTTTSNDDVFCCVSGSSYDLEDFNLPVVSTRGQSQSSNSSFYSTSTACSNNNASVSMPTMISGRPIAPREYREENEDDQMLSSLPKSYEEFVESKESSAIAAVAAQPRAFMSQASHSPSCSSQRTSSLNCGRTDSVLTPSTSPSLVDPDDLEVQMINESFEDQVKQAQVLSDQKTKEAFYRQPNSTATVSSSSTCSSAPKRTLSTSSSQMTQQGVVGDDVFCLPPHSFSSVASTASLKSAHGSTSTKIESFAFPSPHKLDMKKPVPQSISTSHPIPCHHASSFNEPTAPVSTGRGLTWAGWGGGASEAVPTVVSLKTKFPSSHNEREVSADLSRKDSAGLKLTFDNLAEKPENASNVRCVSAVDEDTVNLEQLGEEMIASLLLDENELDSKMPHHAATVADDDLGQSHQHVEVSLTSPPSVPPPTMFTLTQTMPSASLIVVPTTSAAAPSIDVKTTVKRHFNADDFFSKAVNSATIDDGVGSNSSPMVYGNKQDDESVVERWEDIVDVEDFIPSLSHKAVSDFGPTGAPKTIDYLKFDFKKSVALDNDLDHVLEAYGFPASYGTIDSMKSAFQFECRVDFVDDKHALIVLADKDIAFQALQYAHPVIKLRTLHDATAQSKRKAKENAALMKPYRARPETNAFLARRLVESHLGRKSSTSNDIRKQERVKIQSARETKRIVAQLKEDSWLGLN